MLAIKASMPSGRQEPGFDDTFSQTTIFANLCGFPSTEKEESLASGPSKEKEAKREAKGYQPGDLVVAIAENQGDRHPAELNFVKGDTIEVVEQHNTFWCSGRVWHGEAASQANDPGDVVGYFPIAFVQSQASVNQVSGAPVLS